METKDRIRLFLEDQFLIDFGDELSADTDLFKAGVIDSFGYVRLMSFLREDFSLEVATEDMLMNVLVSLEAMTEFVTRHSAVRGAATCAE
jgi:D-alanine--poly(phosphoribitol) ligase subunit 2